MEYRLLVVGRRARDPLLEAADKYLERLGHYARIELLRVREGTAESERDALLAKLRPGEHLVALDERGRQPSSEELARTVERWQRSGRNRVSLVIGGAAGLHADVRTRAAEVMSLSRLTLPHRLALVVLAEQLYRAHTILRGEPYHRA